MLSLVNPSVVKIFWYASARESMVGLSLVLSWSTVWEMDKDEIISGLFAGISGSSQSGYYHRNCSYFQDLFFCQGGNAEEDTFEAFCLQLQHLSFP